MSSRPKLSTANCTAAFAAASSRTSSVTGFTRSPYCATRGASSSVRRAPVTTLSPAASAASAMFRPKPFPLPVINQTLAIANILRSPSWIELDAVFRVIVSTHSFIRCTDSLLGYAGPEHLKAAIPVFIRFGWVRRRKVYRRLCQGCQRLRDKFRREIIPKHTLLNRVTNHDLELDERRATGVSRLFGEYLRHL